MVHAQVVVAGFDERVVLRNGARAVRDRAARAQVIKVVAPGSQLLHMFVTAVAMVMLALRDDRGSSRRGWSGD
jgi:hypothetical protein